MPVREFTWARQPDEQWAARVTIRMLWHHNAPVEAVDEAVAQAHQAVADSGLSAEELFGPPTAYAAEAVREFAPAQQRAAADLDGGAPLLTYDEVLFGVCLSGLAVSAWLFTTGRPALAVTPGTVALAVGLLAGGTASVAARRARFNGYLGRAALLWWVTGGAVAAGAATAVGRRPAVQPLAQLPVPVLAIASVVAGVVGWRLPIPLHSDQDTGLSADEWFQRLYGLLRGRWRLSPAQALQFTEQARHHWQLSGSGHPQEEYGTPPVHALHLTGGTRGARSAGPRVPTAALLALAVELARPPSRDTHGRRRTSTRRRRPWT